MWVASRMSVMVLGALLWLPLAGGPRVPEGDPTRDACTVSGTGSSVAGGVETAEKQVRPSPVHPGSQIVFRSTVDAETWSLTYTGPAEEVPLPCTAEPADCRPIRCGDHIVWRPPDPPDFQIFEICAMPAAGGPPSCRLTNSLAEQRTCGAESRVDSAAGRGSGPPPGD